MNDKKRKQIEKTAKAVVARRRKDAEPKEVAAEPTPTPQPVAVASVVTPKAAKLTKVGSLPPMPKMPSNRKNKVRPQVDCKCGCGGKTAGTWVPGHDARAKGWAIRLERNIVKMSDIPESERTGAKHMLEARKSQPKADIKLVSKPTDVAVNE